MGKELTMRKLSVICVAWVVLRTALSAQITLPLPTDTTAVALPDSTKERYVYLLHADETRFDQRINPDAQILVGDVVFRHDSMYMYCDSALFYETSNSLDAYGNVKMNQGDTLFLYGDRLHYNGDEMLAKVRENVVMIDKEICHTVYLFLVF
jgi:lipopolysaccharide assembly outer membrane protein LptD (OstA)